MWGWWDGNPSAEVASTGYNAGGGAMGHCKTVDGKDCEGDLRRACDEVRSWMHGGYTGNETAETMCLEVPKWWITGRGTYAHNVPYGAIYDACDTIRAAGMRIVQRHGL